MSADTLGGVWHYALELARGLSAHDVEVTLATLGGPLSAEQRMAARAIPRLLLHESSLRLEWMREPWEDIARAGDWLLELADATQPDVIHLNHFSHGALPWRAPVLVVAHSCVYSWYAAVRQNTPEVTWERYRRAVRRGLAGADLVIAPSAAMLAAVQRFYGPLSDVEVIANGRRSVDFPPGAKKPRILSAGRLWDEGKNVLALAHAAPHLHWPVRLLGAARGPDGQQFASTSIELRGSLGRQELAHEYGEAPIYASPARYEPFGLGSLEAALAGAALVLGDIPSLREVWGQAALYVSPQDAGALIAVLNDLIRTPGKRCELAARAYRRALAYSAARMSKAYLAAYARLSGALMKPRLLNCERELG